MPIVVQLSGSDPPLEEPLLDDEPPLDVDDPPLDPPLDEDVELPVLPDELPDDDDDPVLPDEPPDEDVASSSPPPDSSEGVVGTESVPVPPGDEVDVVVVELVHAGTAVDEACRRSSDLVFGIELRQVLRGHPDRLKRAA